MNQHFRDLFEYNKNCNQKLIDIIKNNSNIVSQKSLELFSHILNAHHIWNHRIQTIEGSYNVWEIHSIETLKRIDDQNHEVTFTIIKEGNLDQNMSYQNSRGQNFQNCIKDVLFHIINHSTYHRGQLAREFKLCGIEPLNTDYIFYKR